MTADLRAGKVTCHVDVAAPREGRPATRVNWLVRQLRNAPETVRVEAFAAHARGASSADLLRNIRENPALLITDPLRELKTFRVALDRPLGAKRGRGRGSFIDSVLDAVDSFYADVMQNLKAWAAHPPKVRETGETPPVAPALVSTALSSQDGSEAVVAPPRALSGESLDVSASPDDNDDAAPPQWADVISDTDMTEATDANGLPGGAVASSP